MPTVERVVDSIIKHRLLLFVICLILVGISIYPSTQLKFERSIENLFRQDDPRYENYRLDQRLFGGIESAVVAYDDEQLFTRAGLKRLIALQQQISSIVGIGNVTGLNDIRRPSAPLDGRKLLEQVEAGSVSIDDLKREILASDLYAGRFVSASGNTPVLLVELLPIEDDPQVRADAIAQLRNLCESSQPPCVLSGGPILVEEVYRTLETDGVILGLASSLILTLVIAVLFRSLRWTVLPLIVVHATLFWTKSILALSGAKLSMVSAPLVAMVTVIGVATVVHVIIRYREEREQRDAEPALRATLIHILPAIFWTCTTTAIGFAALLACSISPIQVFALMMSLGSLLVFVTTVLLVPGAALFAKQQSRGPGRIPAESSLTQGLENLVHGVQRYPLRVVAMLILLLVFCLLGVSRLQVATDFTDNFRHNSSIVQSYFFLKDRLGSLNTVDVLIDVPDPSKPEFDATVRKIRELQEELEQDGAVSGTLSFVDLLDFISGDNSGEHGSGMMSWLPSLNVVPKRTQLVLLNRLEPRIVSGFWNVEQNTARIIVFARHVDGAAGKAQFIERIESIARDRFPSTRVAGIFVLLAYVVQSLLADQWITFALSVAAIFLVMSIAFRSISLGLAAMVPNAAPILMVIGTMGWLGLDMNIATAMMASVSMGLSVDFSIHYLSRFKQELRNGSDFYSALGSAHRSVGLAMVIANLALIAGFLVLTMSSLIPSVHFGMMVSVAMLGGLAGNLVLLPLLLRVLWQANLLKLGVGRH